MGGNKISASGVSKKWVKSNDRRRRKKERIRMSESQWLQCQVSDAWTNLYLPLRLMRFYACELLRYCAVCPCQSCKACPSQCLSSAFPSRERERERERKKERRAKVSDYNGQYLKPAPKEKRPMITMVSTKIWTKNQLPGSWWKAMHREREKLQGLGLVQAATTERWQ